MDQDFIEKNTFFHAGTILRACAQHEFHNSDVITIERYKKLLNVINTFLIFVVVSHVISASISLTYPFKCLTLRIGILVCLTSVPADAVKRGLWGRDVAANVSNELSCFRL